jgi:acetyl esterase/lipase
MPRLSILRSLSWAVPVVSLLVLTAGLSAAEPKVELLWPEGAPGAVANEENDKPSLTIWLPSAVANTRSAVVLCPGGGYGGLAIDHEGKQIAEYFDRLGVATFMLKYRLAPKYKHPTPMLDVQRAVRLVRSRAKEFGIEPNRIGVMGFSAGGHLASTAATHFEDGKPDAADVIERASSRPDFAILCYPVISMELGTTHGGSRKNLLGENPPQELVDLMSNDKQVTAQTPPTFIFHTTEDTAVLPENAILFYSALRKAKVPAELHIYERGRHGVGLAANDPHLSQWSVQLAGWLRMRGWLDRPKFVAATVEEASTDPDFAVQGEYAGEIPTADGPVKFGLQIIAEGRGKFSVVAYKGGLPGDGWDGSEKKRGQGEFANGVVTFKNDHAQATWKNGAIEISDLNGNFIATLPKVVRQSQTLGQKPDAGAVVLFDGTSGEAFSGARVTEDGLLMQGVTSQQKFGDCRLHVEFRLPYQPEDRGQARGNSGCYLQGRYEVQMLDSFGLEGLDNECGGIYSVKKPDLNMCYPPLAWQTYDIEYEAAKYDEAGKKTKNAVITVRHNGVTIHHQVELPKGTTAAPVPENAQPGPLYLQDHGNPVRYRNIWLVEGK